MQEKIRLLTWLLQQATHYHFDRYEFLSNSAIKLTSILDPIPIGLINSGVLDIGLTYYPIIKLSLTLRGSFLDIASHVSIESGLLLQF